MDIVYGGKRDPYLAAEEDAFKALEDNSPLLFNKDDEDEILKTLMEKEKWSLEEAKDYFAHYWKVYEDNRIEEAPQDEIDDDFDWGIV